MAGFPAVSMKVITNIQYFLYIRNMKAEKLFPHSVICFFQNHFKI